MDNKAKRSTEETSTSEEALAGKLNSTLNLQANQKYIYAFNQKFEIIKELGAGSFGIVSLVSQDGQLKAIKQIDKGKLSGAFSKFSKEYLLFENLSHPHIIKHLGHFEALTTVCLILEYASCGSFSNLLKKKEGNGLTRESTWFYLFQMISALDYLRCHAIVHRDLKSDNILIQSEVLLKVADFGLAIKLDKPDGKVFGDAGTPAYKAPEVLVENMGYGVKCDIFSLGIIIAEAVTGAAPGVDILERGKPKIRGEFVYILEKLLEQNPEMRYSIDDIKEFFRKKFDRDAFKLVMNKAFVDHGSPIPESEKIITIELELYDNVITHGRNISATQYSDVSFEGTPPDCSPPASEFGGDFDGHSNGGSTLKLSDETSRTSSMGSFANGTSFSSELLADDITQESSQASIAEHSHGGIDSSQIFADESSGHVTAASQSSTRDATSESLTADITQESSQTPIRGRYFLNSNNGPKTYGLFADGKQYNFDNKGKNKYWRCKFAKQGQKAKFPCNAYIRLSDITELGNNEVEISTIYQPHLDTCQPIHDTPKELL